MASEESPMPAYNAETVELLDKLKRIVGEQHDEALFVCGGSIPISEPDKTGGAAKSDEETDDKLVTSAPITIRWDPPSSAALAKDAKVVFPLEPDAKDNLSNLVSNTEPATFGYQGQDVLDETYRKASKLDPTQFSTNFNPYELGIIDTIAQVLLPSVKTSDSYRAVRAELYKLNIYSGPSGKFKAHVDTPRSSTQFGSLVVCLPVDHEGGQLLVRHKGKEVTFDWGDSNRGIQFAAFYSDVEHEVLEVQSGHRVTLTYNLYAVRGNGLLTGHCPTLDAKQLPLYQSAHEILGQRGFMEEGGYLGFFCAHAYAHTDKEKTIFPEMLKGIDMAIWEAFSALGLEVSVRPVIEDDEYYETYYKDESYRNVQRFVGTGIIDTYDMGSEEYSHPLEYWPDDRLKMESVQWLTEPGNLERQIDFLAYGNEHSLGAVYSNCALLVEVPEWSERGYDGNESG